MRSVRDTGIEPGKRAAGGSTITRVARLLTGGTAFATGGLGCAGIDCGRARPVCGQNFVCGSCSFPQCTQITLAKRHLRGSVRQHSPKATAAAMVSRAAGACRSAVKPGRGFRYTGASHCGCGLAGPRIAAKKACWIRRVTGPGLPSPTVRPSISRTGVISVAVPVKNTSLAE